MPTPHVDVAAYVLGILDEPEDATFARHFAQCPRCRDEYRELSDLPVLLDQLKPNRREPKRSRPSPAPRKQLLDAVLDQTTAARRRQRRTVWLAAAAAVVLLVTVPLVVWKAGGNAGPVAATTVTVSAKPPTTTTTASATVAGARTLTATNATTGVTGTLTMEPEPWGTEVTLQLRGITGPLQYQLVAVSRSGQSQVVTSWQVPPAGFGVPASPEPLRVRGGIGIAPVDIERFDVRRDNGPEVLTLPT